MKLTQNTGKIIGFSLVAMFLLAIFTLMGLDSKIIVSGDRAATLQNIEAYPADFWTAVAGYFLILALDVLVSLGLYSLLAGNGKKMAWLTAASRLGYTVLALISLIALCFYNSVFYEKGLLFAYILFILHLLFLGLSALKVKGIPSFFGILLIFAVPCYIILTYGYLVLSTEWNSLLSNIVMLPAALAELLLGFWLIIKSRRLSEENNG